MSSEFDLIVNFKIRSLEKNALRKNSPLSLSVFIAKNEFRMKLLKFILKYFVICSEKLFIIIIPIIQNKHALKNA